MAGNPLFYKEIVPLDRVRHRAFELKSGTKRFDFAAQSHMVPVVVDEFGLGGRHLPIVFVPGASVPSVVFLLGLSPGDNRFVSPDASWIGDYIPAFVRRYPFIIGEIEGAEPVVCIDEVSSVFVQSEGEPLFLENGEEAPVLRDNIRFINDYMTAARRTDMFVAEIAALDLFQSITVDIKLTEHDSRTLHGLMMISGDKLNALPDADFLKLRDRGYLPLIYAHHASLACLDRLKAGTVN